MSLSPFATLAALAFAAGAAMTGAAMADQPAMKIPGGTLDPAYPRADVFIGMPRSGTVPPGKACEVAQQYVELINAGEYARVAQLYADDATFLEPMRPTLHGRKEIDAFYTGQIGAMRPQIVAVSYLGNDSECAITLAIRRTIDGQERYTLVSVDHFVVGEDGRIISMAAFARPAPATGASGHE